MKQLVQRRKAIEPYYSTKLGRLYCGDVLATLKSLPSESVQCCVTSPPYLGQRDYQIKNQIGLNETPEQFIEKLRLIFAEVKRLLKDDGVLWVNIDTCYNGSGQDFGKTIGTRSQQIRSLKVGEAHPMKARRFKEFKNKDLIPIPWMLGITLQKDKWYLRQDIIWHKPNSSPESVEDRCVKAHEYLFLLSKNKKYFFDYKSIKTLNNANKKSVWTVNTEPYSEAHFATFPLKLIEPCIKAGTKKGDIVLDPFMGSGTTGYLCEVLDRKWIGIELNQNYCDLAKKRINQEALKPKLF